MPRTARIAVILFLLFVLIYGLTARSGVQVSDEAAVFATAVSLATQGNLAIDHMQWLQDSVGIGRTGPDGHLYTKYFPGNVLGAAAIYALAARSDDQPYVWQRTVMAPSNSAARLALKLNAVLGALAMAGLFLVLSRDYSLRTAVITTLLIGLTSDWWYQSRGFFSEIGAGAFLILSLYAAKTNKPYLSSTALAASILFRPLNLLALPIWLYAVARAGRKAIWSIVPLVAGGLLLAAYNQLRFGSLFDFGYGREEFNTSILVGLYGIVLSPGRSLFMYSPIFLLAIPGAVLLYRLNKSLLFVCAITIAAYGLTISLWHAWDGGWTWGSRLLTPVVPLIGVLIAPVVDRSGSGRRLMIVIVILAMVGFGVQVVALARDPAWVMVTQVLYGNVPYDDTLYTIGNSWLALQARSLGQWQPCDLDAYSLRLLVCR